MADEKSDFTTALEMTTDPSLSEVALLTGEHEKNIALACNKSCDPDPLPSVILSKLVGSLMSGRMPLCIHCLRNLGQNWQMIFLLMWV